MLPDKPELNSDAEERNGTETKMNKIIMRWATRATVLGLLVLGLWGCGENVETGVDAKPPPSKVKRVKVSPVKALPPEGNIEYVGVLSAHRKLNVSSEIGGTIEKLYFERGDRVKQGQLLAEISTSSIRLEVRMAEAALKEAEADRSEAEKHFSRMKDLHESSVISNSKYDAAKRRGEMAQARKASAEQQLALAKDRLEKSRLRAHSSGIMAFRDVEAGEVIPPGTIITQVVDLSRYKVKISVSENDISALRGQNTFKFSIDAIPAERFTCKLSFLSPTAEPSTRSFPVELTVDAPDPRMADGMTVRVKFPLVDEKKTIKVPSAWLAEEDGKMGVFVLQDGKAQFSEVALGAYYDQRVEILSGLRDNELVITNPAGIRTGDAVKY
jgi:RND family efflux transporter MFP subunit